MQLTKTEKKPSMAKNRVALQVQPWQLPVMKIIQITALAMTMSLNISLLEHTTMANHGDQSWLPPLPVLPIPSHSQLKWQRREMIMFFHFGMNTFTNSEWGNGRASPKLFNPSSLNTSQWVDVAKSNGVSLVIFTAKHHDGFCLWPSPFTKYSIKASPWKDGHGDLVHELASSVEMYGLDLGLYLSPWDRHDPRYGNTKLYNQYYMAQLHELLTRYGPISEIWFDGAKGIDAPKMKYMFKKWFAWVHQLQEDINIFSDAGPNVRWVGDEQGSCNLTCWSMMNATHAKIGVGSNPELLNMGDPYGVSWAPPECDVSIRPGWFWHANEQPKKPIDLLDIYYKSVGRNCVLLLNVPPNSSGLISSEDIRALLEFKKLRDSIFGSNMASNIIAKVHASTVRGPPFMAHNILDADPNTFWTPLEGHTQGYILLTLKSPIVFNVVGLREPIQFGQRVAEYEVKVRVNKEWKHFSSGSTIGYQKLDRGCIVKTRHVKLLIYKSRSEPLISFISLHFDPYSLPLYSCTSKSL